MGCGKIRKTTCLMLAGVLTLTALSSCAGEKKPDVTTTVTTTALTHIDILAELPDVNEQIKKLNNVEGNIWINEDEKYKDILGHLKSQIKDNVSVRGSIIIATDDDVLLASGTRLKDREGKEVTPDTTYEIGSLTKSMTAVCIMKLAEEGKLSLTDTLGDYFAEFSSAPFYSKVSKVTVSNLLHMRSGIPDYVNDPENFWGLEKAALLAGKESELGEKFCRFFAENADKAPEQAFCTEPNVEPDTKFEYSNTNYLLLAEIIEKVSGKSYAEFMEETIFKPCGLTNTTAMKDGNVQASISKNAWYAPTCAAKGCGDVHSSVVDILKYNRALFGGYLLNKESMKELLEPIDNYACGWEYLDKIVHHAGTTAGFSTMDCMFTGKDGKRYYVIMCANYGEECVFNLLVPMSGLSGA
ncbi:MAG: beta-lactamase family protein [Clostridiales bacterium]|nr:beta-lactamase family protein [Clostridiales bacterium]